MESNENKRILYADDDADDRFLFEAALEQVNPSYKVQLFENGLLLEKALAESNYAAGLIFLDLNMPGKNGIDTLAALQPAIKENALKIIVFTTAADNATIKKTFELNASLFVQKPNNFGDLVSTLRTIILKNAHAGLPIGYPDFKFKLTHE